MGWFRLPAGKAPAAARPAALALGRGPLSRPKGLWMKAGVQSAGEQRMLARDGGPLAPQQGWRGRRGGT